MNEKGSVVARSRSSSRATCQRTTRAPRRFDGDYRADTRGALRALAVAAAAHGDR